MHSPLRLVVYNTDQHIFKTQYQLSGPQSVGIYICSAALSYTSVAPAAVMIYLRLAQHTACTSVLSRLTTPMVCRQAPWSRAGHVAIIEPSPPLWKSSANRYERSQLAYVRIAPESSYLVGAMTRDMEEWIENDGIGSNGQTVTHYNELKGLHESVDDMSIVLLVSW